MKEHTRLLPFSILFSLVLALLLMGCGENDPPAPTLALTPLPTAVSQLPPTFTPPQPFERFFATFPAVTVTQQPLPVQATDTPIPFGDTAVELRYRIPALGLDRRLQGTISSQIVIVDETTGQAIQRANQADVLLQLQQVLPDLLLPVVPEGCDTCVFISFDLPYAQLHNEGWLRDPVLLASLENYMAVGLGPHFPAGTVAGLRRSASPYAPAHTIALTSDGLLYTWLATEPEVSLPVAAAPELLQLVAEFSAEGLDSEYVANCAVAPLEKLFVQSEEQAGVAFNIVCPEYSLPLSLLPLYAGLDAALAEKLAQSDAVLPRPPTDFPLTAVLDYQRTDGARLTLFADGTAVTVSPTGEQFTTVLSTTQTISLTSELIANGIVRTGLNAFQPEEPSVITTAGGVTTTVTTTPRPPRTVLVVRGPSGVYDAEWFELFDLPELQALNDLLGQLLLTTVSEPEETAIPEGTVEPESTIEPESTATPALVGTAVPVPTSTP